MKKSSPTISVIMPVYNAEQHLVEAIESILNQTYKDFEFIIINDGSTDNSEKIILSFKDRRIKYIKNDENLQIVKTLNKGLFIACGEFIARMDADDISLETRFEEQLNHMNKNNIDVCGSWVQTIGKNKQYWKFPILHDEIKVNLLFHSSIAHPSVMIRKKVFETHKYKEEFNKAEDYALWVEIINKFKCENLPKLLLSYRIHDTQTNKKAQISVANKVRLKMLENFTDEFSAKEQQLFLKFVNNNMILYEELERLTRKILEINIGNGYFNEVYLKQLLFDRLAIVLSCQTNCIKNFYKLFVLSNKLNFKFNFYRYFKSLLKCLCKKFRR